MTDWPETIRIGWLDHKLRPFAESEGAEKGLRGQYICLEGVNEIRYDARMTPAQQAHTILHECLHGIREVCLPFGWVKSIGDQAPNWEDAEEVIVSGFADGLSTLCADNPLLWTCICQRLVP